MLYTANADARSRTGGCTLLANPMAVIITSYQAIFYEHRLADPRAAGRCGAGLGGAALGIAAQVFERRREEFAELV